MCVCARARARAVVSVFRPYAKRMYEQYASDDEMTSEPDGLDWHTTTSDPGRGAGVSLGPGVRRRHARVVVVALD